VVLLNLDAGEHDDEPEDLWALADVVSVACGGHAGDERSMARVVRFIACRDRPKLGAHPSYPDRQHFGRRSMQIDPEALRATITEQLELLEAIAAAHGQRVEWVKPHGALYHDAAKQLHTAAALLFGVRDALGTNVAIIGPPRGVLADTAEKFGFRYLREGFADRATRADGMLVPRDEPGALITNPTEAAARALLLANEVDTICVHADTPGALEIARAVRDALVG
jgi:UPF0271 protein